MRFIRYSDDQKTWAIEQMMPPLNRSIVALAKSTGITTVTLRKWQNAAREQGKIVPASDGKTKRWSSADKFQVVLETAALGAVELSEYCRRKGIYPEQIEQWRAACIDANQESAASDSPANRKRVRELERALKRKDKELIEAQVLLELQKKLEAIWGRGKAE